MQNDCTLGDLRCGTGLRFASGNKKIFVLHSELARALGVRCTAAGLNEADSKQALWVAGLYAAGDVVNDLHQLSVAEGHAALGATAIHSSLPRDLR